MLPLTEISEIKLRAEAINLSLKRLCVDAGIDPSTAYRAARGTGDNRGRTLRKLNDALIQHETTVALSLLKQPHVQAALADAVAAQGEAA